MRIWIGFSCTLLLLPAACSNDASGPPPIKDSKGRNCSRLDGEYRPTCDVEPAAACFAGNQPCYQLEPSGLVDYGGKTMVGALAICARCCSVNGDFAGGVNRADCGAVLCQADTDCAGEPGVACKDGVCRK
jgi:hypothetical protein